MKLWVEPMFLVINYIHVCNNHKKCYLFLFCFKLSLSLSLSLFCIGCGESLGQGGARVALRSRGGWLIADWCCWTWCCSGWFGMGDWSTFGGHLGMIGRSVEIYIYIYIYINNYYRMQYKIIVECKLWLK